MSSSLEKITLPEMIPQADGRRLRPQLHFTAPNNWINDPNGLVVLDGTIHLFYQVNPYGTDWGNISWGHAVGKDYISWNVLDVAIPDTPVEASFSGSAVYDKHNTSGLGTPEQPPLVALYTGARHDNYIDQHQNLAFSLDRGTTWTKYDGNPVLPSDRFDIRDPKVFWHEQSAQWIMTLVFADTFQVGIYISPNLIDWSLGSVFGPSGGTAGEWECSDLFPLAVQDQEVTKWVMLVSVADGAPAKGSGVQYFVGDFDGTTFTPDCSNRDLESNWLDYGPDFYAAQSWSNIPAKDGRTVVSAWMSNRDYATRTPTGTWRGCHTLPRELSLVSVGDGYQLAQQPVRELKKYRKSAFRVADHALEGEFFLSGNPAKSNQFEIHLRVQERTAQRFVVKVCVSEEFETAIILDFTSQTLQVDRRKSGVSFDAGFDAVASACLAAVEGCYELRVIVDNSTLEVFANAGLVSLSSLIFPPAGAEGLSIRSESGVTHIEELELWSLG